MPGFDRIWQDSWIGGMPSGDVRDRNRFRSRIHLSSMADPVDGVPWRQRQFPDRLFRRRYRWCRRILPKSPFQNESSLRLLPWPHVSPDPEFFLCGCFSGVPISTRFSMVNSAGMLRSLGFFSKTGADFKDSHRPFPNAEQVNQKVVEMRRQHRAQAFIVLQPEYLRIERVLCID